MDTCHCHRSDKPASSRRFTRRATLQAAGLAAATLVTPGLVAQVASAQTATPAALPDSGPSPDLTDVTPLPLTGERLATLETYVTTKLAELRVPGASVAVVQNGEVAFLQGFGVRELNQPEPLTADTLLRIGSCTKSFSSMLTGTLVDSGELTWDTPVADLLPTFAVADPDLTPRITMSDAFCACTGLPRRDLEFELRGLELSPEIVVADMKNLPLTAPYGEKFQYNNQMVATGGFAAAVAAGGRPDELSRAYDVALRDRVLNPIGMTHSTMDLPEVVSRDDYAIPHAPDLTGAPMPFSILVDDEWIRPIEPSGAIWSSAADMARYVQTELSRGVAPDGVRVISTENLERTWQPGAAMTFGPGTPELIADSLQHYALGWWSGTYHGQRVVSHTGASYGYAALVAFLPDADLGVVVLTNMITAGGYLAAAIQFRLMEILFDLPEAIDPILDGAFAMVASAQADLLSQLGQVDPEAVAPYLGQYSNPALGEMTLSLQGDALLFDSGGARSTLLPRLDDDGAVIDYVFSDPPWANNPIAMWITLEDADGAPQVTLIAHGDSGEADLVYPYEAV